MNFRHITLEMSLKPFKKTDSASIRRVTDRVFEQWKPLFKGVESAGIMLWTADGSEILDYTGDLSKTFEWCKFIGSANPSPNIDNDPEFVSLHAHPVLYTENPPVMTYGILKDIVNAIRESGRKILGDNVQIRVIETFDIGPEFAISDFKYHRHPEIVKGMAMGAKCFIDSYGILNADTYPYAAYPNGIPDKTPFGTFLGAQSRRFLSDLGFDALWLSNGVGFSADPWTSKGAVFDGKDFHTEALAETKRNVMSFWKLFREECPDYLIETRGTNFSAGIDYSVDAVPMWDLYNADFNMLAPPNSPWAALDSNFGLELMGHMTRISHLPSNNRYLFRYYVHDPWWMNSPWYDRYEGQPHDIYLPMALTRLDSAGNAMSPTDFNILSIDNSFGDLPDSCAIEPLPHLLKAEKDAPDAPSPVVWVYPTREYTTAGSKDELQKMFSNDWFIAEAINNGLPLSTVVSTDNFGTVPVSKLSESIVFSPVPKAGSIHENKIFEALDGGVKVLLYGPVDQASPKLLARLNLTVVDKGISGEIPLTESPLFDTVMGQDIPKVLCVHEKESAGCVNTVLSSANKEEIPLIMSGKYVLAVSDGSLAWYRATASQQYKDGHKYLVPDDRDRYAISESLIRSVLSTLGVSVKFNRPVSTLVSPAVMVGRNDNGFFFSTFAPFTSVETSFRFPDGAPLLVGYDTVLKGGYSSYRFPRADHRECRVFIDGMTDGWVDCREVTCELPDYRRRFEVRGLKDATVTFYPESYCIDSCRFMMNASFPFVNLSKVVPFKRVGNCVKLEHLTGTLSIQLPRTKPGRNQVPHDATYWNDWHNKGV